MPMFCIFNSPPPFFLLNTLIIIKKKSIKDDMTIKCTLHFLFDFKLYVLLIPPSPPPLLLIFFLYQKNT